MAPRKKNTTAKAVKLPSVQRADGRQHTNLSSLVSGRYESIKLYSDPEGKNLLATVVAPEGEEVSKIGSSLIEFFNALVEGAFSGQGQGPEGSVLYVAEHFEAVQRGTDNNIRELYVEAIPAESTRAGFRGYMATVGDLYSIVQPKAKILEEADKRYGPTKTRSRKTADKVEEVTVLL